MWLYGCLSNDTEILTSNGWRNSETINKNDFIYSLDLDNNKIIKNKVLNIFKYDYDGEMVNLKNQNTDQLLTPNHHCIVKDTTRTRIKGQTTHYTKHDYWNYKDAWQLRSQTIELPLASNYNGKIEIGNLFAELLGWVISEGNYLKDTNAIMITQSDVNYEYVKRIRYILGKLKIKHSEYSRVRKYKDREYIEYDFYIGNEAVEIVNKIKELAPNKKLTYKLLELSLKNKEFLLKGLCKGDGSKSNTEYGFSAFYQKDIEQLEIFQTLLHLTNKQGWINNEKYCCSIHLNPNTQLQGKHNKDRFVKYDGGYVWCIETEIGNFIARRNGKIFITGNSGFPKSLNIGLAIDKRNGVDNRTGNVREDGAYNSKHFSLKEEKTMERVFEEHKAQNEWEGWGTCLKPAYEPIIVARKPVENSIIDNVLKYGVGGINIDECRVPAKQGEYDIRHYTNEDCFQNLKPKESKFQVEPQPDGRFPANVILTYDENDFEEVCGGMPSNKSNGSDYNFELSNQDNTTHLYTNIKSGKHFEDEGSASRYFYCAKATKFDRDEGLEKFENVSGADITGRKEGSAGLVMDGGKQNPFAGKASPNNRNTHPTVKPCELMRYLVRLVSPKGATVLDCFNGSGSTGKAVMLENKEFKKDYKYIGIELTEEYLPISKARIEYICDNNFDFYTDENNTTQHVAIQKGYNKTSIFDLLDD